MSHRLRPSASQPGPCRVSARSFPGKKSRITPPLDLISPSESIIAPGPSSLIQTRLDDGPRTPLMGSCYPSVLEDRSIHQPRPCLSRYVPPSPFLTTSTVCSAPIPPGVSPRSHSWAFLPFRVPPTTWLLHRLRHRTPSWSFPAPSRSRRGTNPGAPLYLQGIIPRCDRYRRLPVSLPSGLAPSWAFLWDLAPAIQSFP